MTKATVHPKYPQNEMKKLQKALDRLYTTFDFELHRKKDPIEFPHRYKKNKDIETVAFITALFSYGKVDIFKSFLEAVFHVMGSSPFDFLRQFTKIKGNRLFKGFKYRFNTDADLVLLLLTLKKVLSRSGSLGEVFIRYYRESERDMRASLTGFVEDLFRTACSIERPGRGMRHLFPSPKSGGACKRLNLFLRWMVRDHDVDLGLWKGIQKSDLIIPLDTHIGRVSRCIGLTKRKSSDWRTALEITEALKRFDPLDPLKYDFALCHQGISGICRADRSLCYTCDFQNGGIE